MEPLHKLRLFSDNSAIEIDSARSCESENIHNIPISEAIMPNGKKIKLLKAMVTSACERNCNYCPFRAGRDFRRATFSPDELALSYYKLHKANIVEGLFLSSGIAGGGIRIQDKIIATADILRKKYAYKGYMHLKIMPGIERAQLIEVMNLADRISINLEAPSSKYLEKLAPKKKFLNELISPMKMAVEIKRNLSPHNAWKGLWPSITTQFVVGAVGESDIDLISTSEKLFQQFNLRRIFYSIFNPIRDTPFENLPPGEAKRKIRLYQCSYLLRDYGFNLEELEFNSIGHLPLNADPKLIWAKTNLSHNPIEINHASKMRLLKIPGIGPITATRIIKNRRQGKIVESSQLKKMGVNTHRAGKFILLNGKRAAHQNGLL